MIFRYLHISTKRLLTLFALLLRLSCLGTMPETITELSLSFTNIASSIIIKKVDLVFSHYKNDLFRYVLYGHFYIINRPAHLST